MKKNFDLLELQGLGGPLWRHNGQKSSKISNSNHLEHFWPICKFSKKIEKFFEKKSFFGPKNAKKGPLMTIFWALWRHNVIFQKKISGHAKFQKNSRFSLEGAQKVRILCSKSKTGRYREDQIRASHQEQRRSKFLYIHFIHLKEMFHKHFLLI